MLETILNYLAANAPAVGTALGALMGKFGWLVTALSWIATLRLIFKPLMSWLKAGADLTPTQIDNAFLDRLADSSIYKGIAWFLDFSASIKIPVNPNAATVASLAAAQDAAYSDGHKDGHADAIKLVNSQAATPNV